jgi:hypothetical protein
MSWDIEEKNPFIREYMKDRGVELGMRYLDAINWRRRQVTRIQRGMWHLRRMGWSYERIGAAFNCHATTVRGLVLDAADVLGPVPTRVRKAKHGTRSGYLAGCRDPERCPMEWTCTDANTAYQQAYRAKRKAEGRPVGQTMRVLETDSL